jgi:hypothetical protein
MREISEDGLRARFYDSTGGAPARFGIMILF